MLTTEKINGLLAEHLAEIDRQIAVMQDYLKLRLELNDDHGCMDASADLRELKAKRDVLKAFVQDLFEEELTLCFRCKSPISEALFNINDKKLPLCEICFSNAKDWA